jgi:hypothetical protein
MKSYIKLYGPPISEAIKALRKVAVGFPEVCMMDSAVGASLGINTFTGAGGVGTGGMGAFDSPDSVQAFFGGPDEISKERCDSIISKSGESVGEYDFYFEWFKKPNVNQIEDLISKIDEALAPVGVRYTMTTK